MKSLFNCANKILTVHLLLTLIAEFEESFPYRDVKLQKGPLPEDIYDVSKEELGRY